MTAKLPEAEADRPRAPLAAQEDDGGGGGHPDHSDHSDHPDHSHDDQGPATARLKEPRRRRWWRWWRNSSSNSSPAPATTATTLDSFLDSFLPPHPHRQSWDFDVFEVPAEDLPRLLLSFFEDLGLVRDEDHRGALGALLSIAQRHYVERNPYHNFQHCVDVTHATFMMLLGTRGAVTDLECYALLLAAVAHDLEHPGVNNAYLIKTRDPLAITYNDVSVLENRHAACFFEIVSRNPSADVFRHMSDAEYDRTRRLIIHAIIHTDMCKHFPMVDRIRECSASITAASATANPSNDEDRMLFVAAMVLHAADISNPVRAAKPSRAWADRIMEEFFHQGDLEKRAGFPTSPMCDRDATSLCSVQRGFIGSVVAPLYEAMGDLAFLAPGLPGAENVFKVMHARAVDKLQTLYASETSSS